MFAMCLLFAMGCTTPNLRVLYKDNIKATGAIRNNGNAFYYSVCIGTDIFPYDGRQTFAIRLPSGTILSSDDFSEQAIRPIALKLSETGDGTVRYNPERGSQIYFLEGVGFEYKDDQLITMKISFHLSHTKKYIPEISTTASGTFFPFPVSEKHLKEIFGPPDKTNDSRIW